MQWVDFYLEQYKPKPLTFDSRFAAIAFAAIVVISMVFGILQEVEESQFNRLLQQKQQQSKQITQQIKAMKASLQATGQINNDQLTLQQKRDEMKALSKIVNNLRERAKIAAVPYSQVMADLASQTVNKLWLTRIELNSGILSLEGTTTQRNAIPGYIEQLKKQSSLRREFAAMEIEKDKENSRLIHFKLDSGVTVYGR